MCRIRTFTPERAPWYPGHVMGNVCTLTVRILYRHWLHLHFCWHHWGAFVRDANPPPWTGWGHWKRGIAWSSRKSPLCEIACQEPCWSFLSPTIQKLLVPFQSSEKDCPRHSILDSQQVHLTYRRPCRRCHGESLFSASYQEGGFASLLKPWF